MKSRIKTYQELFTGLLAGINVDAITKAADCVTKTFAADKQILTAGNGNSATLATYFAMDFAKNASPTANGKLPRVLSLCCNAALITALGNDCGYENIFSYQLRNLLNQDDLVVLISSSGNSPNIIKAAELAKKTGATVLGMTGFNGGKLKELADIDLHVPCNMYELVDEVHSFFCHAIIHACKKKML